MRKIRIVVVAGALALFTIVPLGPAHARHTCGLEDVDPTVNAICDAHPNDYKLLIQYVYCLVSPSC